MRCDKCNVELIGNHGHCPLCQSDLSGIGSPANNIFPPVTIVDNRRFISWIALLAVIIITLSYAANKEFPAGGSWWILVAAGIGSLWTSFTIAVKKRNNLPKAILWQVFTVTILSFIWDYFTGFHMWSINFVIPVFASCAMAAMAIVSRLLHLNIEDFMIYLILDSFIGFAFFVLLSFEIPTVTLPSLVCFACSVISVSALILLEGSALKTEIQRRLHI